MKFRIVLKNEKSRSYSRLSWFIILINIALLGYLAVSTNNGTEKTVAIISLLLLVMTFMTWVKWKKTPWTYPSFFSIFFLIIFAGWLFTSLFWISIISLVFEILRQAAQQLLVMTVNEDQLKLGNFLPKKIRWGQLNQCILKDGLLTLDFKNNRLIQQLTDDSYPLEKIEDASPVKANASNEAEFNDFCRQQLRK